jgi:hypothetical protein
MTRQPSDTEIWDAWKKHHAENPIDPNLRKPDVPAFVVASITDAQIDAVAKDMGVTPDRVQDVIAMRATTIGVG